MNTTTHPLLQAEIISQSIQLVQHSDHTAVTPTNNSSANNTSTCILTGHFSNIVSVVYGNCGKFIASAESEGIIRLWHSSTGAELKIIPIQNSEFHGTISAIAVSPSDEDIGVVFSDYPGVSIRTIIDSSDTVIGSHSSGVNAITYSSNGQFVSTGSRDKSIKIWRKNDEWSNSFDEICTCVAHQDWISSVHFSPFDSSQGIISGSWDGTIKLWSIIEDRLDDSNQITSPILTLDHSTSSTSTSSVEVTAVQFSPTDSKSIVSSSTDKVVRLWDISTTDNPMKFIGHTERVNSVGFSPDGLLVASASSDRTIRIWDIRNPTVEVQKCVGHESGVTSISFSPDGNQLASGSTDKCVRIWNIM
jgi:WD40 repeat protein